MYQLNRKRIVALVTFGATTWVAALVFGQTIVLLTGIPASSALLNGFIVPFFLVLGSCALRTKWSITISFTVYGILSIPVLLLGPPGVHKVFVALLAGTLTDVLINMLDRFKKIVYPIAFGVWGAMLAVLARVLYEILPLPGKEKFLAAFVTLTVVFVVEAIIGSSVASWMWNKRNLDGHPYILRLRS